MELPLLWLAFDTPAMTLTGALPIAINGERRSVGLSDSWGHDVQGV